MTGPRTAPYWAFTSLVLTIALCVLMTIYARQAQEDYAQDRARDTLYQTNAVLSRALLQAYMIQAYMIQDQIDHPTLPKAHRAY